MSYYTKNEIMSVIKNHIILNKNDTGLNRDKIIHTLRLNDNKIPPHDIILNYYKLNGLSELFTIKITKKQRGL